MLRSATMLGLFLTLTVPALAAQSCPDNPDAIGTSRTITVDPKVLPQIGTMQYAESLPLKDHEVVITFDDGPLPPYSNRILDILAENCVKADYFLVGQMAKTYPDLVRRIYNSGHVVGTHSLHHPLTFNRMGEEALAGEVEGGIEAVDIAIGNPRAVAPFFRIPGLYRSKITDKFLARKSLAVFSADEVANDWHRGITPKQIVAIAMRQIESRNHRGILLLHDIHPATVLALPLLLRQLKENGYHIVQAVPTGDRPAWVPVLEQAKAAGGWPRTLPVKNDTRQPDTPRAHQKKFLHMHARGRREYPRHHGPRRPAMAAPSDPMRYSAGPRMGLQFY